MIDPCSRKTKLLSPRCEHHGKLSGNALLHTVGWGKVGSSKFMHFPTPTCLLQWPVMQRGRCVSPCGWNAVDALMPCEVSRETSSSIRWANGCGCNHTQRRGFYLDGGRSERIKIVSPKGTMTMAPRLPFIAALATICTLQTTEARGVTSRLQIQVRA